MLSEKPLYWRWRQAVGRGIRNGFERLTGWNVYTIQPRGVSLAKDIRRYLPELQIHTIFDVGANVGQSVSAYLKTFPAATVYCFEPVATTFKRLEAAVARSQRARCFRLAMGDASGQAEMVLEGGSDQYRLAEHFAGPGAQARVETVCIETVDRFCEQHSIQTIDLLKIDAEGHDLAVLHGAQRMLGEQRVKVVQVEVGMGSLYPLHVPFERIKTAVEDWGYHLFAFYEQVGEYIADGRVLRRSDAVFVSRAVADGQVCSRQHVTARG